MGRLVRFFNFGQISDVKLAHWLCSNPIWTDQSVFEQGFVTTADAHLAWPKVPDEPIMFVDIDPAKGPEKA